MDAQAFASPRGIGATPRNGLLDRGVLSYPSVMAAAKQDQTDLPPDERDGPELTARYVRARTKHDG